MKVTLLCFAYIREIIGADRLRLELADGLDASGFLDHLCRLYPAIADHRDILRISMNEEFMDSTDPIENGCTLAVFPPVSGG